MSAPIELWDIMYIRHKLFCAVFCLLIVGCTQRFQDTSATLREAFLGFDNVELTKKQVEDLPYASIYARINEGHRIFMVLAYAERNPINGALQLKWMSADKALIVTENGRVVKTLFLPENNLASLSSLERLPPPSPNNQVWQAQYDWQPNYHFGYQARVASKTVSEQLLTSLLWEKETVLIEESVNIDGFPSPMSNLFWLDKQGDVVKSAQWVVPNKLHIELEVLKPASAQ